MRNWVSKNITKIECDCRILRTNPGQYFLLLTHKKETKYKKPLMNTVSLDPGEVTFQTFYSPDGITGKCGDRFSKQTKQIAEKIFKLQSLSTKVNSRSRRNIRHRMSLLRTKIKNKVNDLHCKTAHFLCNNFNTIIIPEFRTKSMTKKSSRNIHKSTVRGLLNLSHHKFLCRLKYKCKMTQRNLLIVDESYTSKTCGSCGKLNKTLGGSRKYICPNCNMHLDRDINGARNILIKTMSDLKDIRPVIRSR